MNTKKLEADIELKKDILAFIEHGGTIVVAKVSSKVRKCQTFRNNKYSTYNAGAKCMNLRNFGVYASLGA